jgi:TonB family protein
VRALDNRNPANFDVSDSQPSAESRLAVPSFAQFTDGPRRGLDVATWLLALLVLAGIILLTLLTGRRMGWSFAKLVGFAGSHATQAVQAANQVSGATSRSAESVMAEPPAAANRDPLPARPAAIPAGGLLVYENEKEVFRLPASRADPQKNISSLADGSISVETEAGASVIKRVEPEYPQAARARQMQGRVVLMVGVRPDGSVDTVAVASGEPVLAQAAMDAVKQWRFRPQAGGGQLESRTREVTFNFRLPQ